MFSQNIRAALPYSSAGGVDFADEARLYQRNFPDRSRLEEVLGYPLLRVEKPYSRGGLLVLEGSKQLRSSHGYEVHSPIERRGEGARFGSI